VVSRGEPRLTAGLGGGSRLDPGGRLAVHGHLPRLPPAGLTGLAASADPGGAAFPLAGALRAAACGPGGRPRVVEVSAAGGGREEEPGSAAGGMLLALAPRLVLDGAFLAACALGAREVTVGVIAGSARSP
jgi:hypothetical protein